MFRSLRLPLFVVLLVVLAPAAAYAHDDVYSFKYVDGEHIVIGHQNVHDAATGIPITYNLRVYDLVGQPLSFTTVQVTIMRDSTVVLDKVLPMSENNDTVFKHEYSETGNYLLQLDFMTADEEVLAQAEFPFVVQKGLTSSGAIFSAPTIIAFLLGILATLAVQRLKFVRAARPA